MSTHSVQFVATPGKSKQLHLALPRAIQETFQRVPGFNGCLVMVSEQEARLVTVVTFWTGQERARLCSQHGERLRLLLFTYVDHWLRTESCLAHCSLVAPPENNFTAGDSPAA